MKILHPPVGWG